jgi:hypothetical protein
MPKAKNSGGSEKNTERKLDNLLLKGGYSIIFASNIFLNSHFIQKRIQNQQFCIHF